ncbi:MAG: S8 family serine peptidase [Bdellovibrionales bacterium]|nr:S8 family serine peptidase [Bdellovibrionales bacterium]
MKAKMLRLEVFFILLLVVSCGQMEAPQEGNLVMETPRDNLHLLVQRIQSGKSLPRHAPNRLFLSSNEELIDEIPFVQKWTQHNLAKSLRRHTFKLPKMTQKQMGVLSLSHLSVEEALTNIYEQGLPKGVTVEPDYLYELYSLSAPNDPFLNQADLFSGTSIAKMWGWHQTLVPSIWQQNIFGGGIIVAVIDSGVGFHNDLGNIANPAEIPGNGIDDDQNGFIDDHRGWNFVNDTNDANDDNGHGSFEASVIVATGDNGRGIVGVAPNATILPVKVVDANGAGLLSDIVAGIDYAVASKARVINLSLGGPASQSLDTAVKTAVAQGIVVVVASGNGDGSGNPLDMSNMSPARVSEVITVGASAPAKNIASFSNYGASMDLVAPGTWILACQANGTNSSQTLTDAQGNIYGVTSGTSMAASFVSGVAALMLSANPGISPSGIETMMRSSAEDLGSAGWDSIYGAGLINANQAVSQALNFVPTALTVQSDVFQIYAGSLIQFSLGISPESGNLNVSVEDLPNGATFDSQTRTFSWTPKVADAHKDYVVTFKGIDSMSYSEIQTVITVKSFIKSVNQENTELPESISCSVGPIGDVGSMLGLFTLLLIILIGIRHDPEDDQDPFEDF